MIQTEFSTESLDAGSRQVLETYAVRELASQPGSDASSGWLDRVCAVPGLDAPALASAHGLLIAEGLLKFEITGRSAGLQYQLSQRGREILSLLRCLPSAGDDGTDEPSPDDDEHDIE